MSDRIPSHWHSPKTPELTATQLDRMAVELRLVILAVESLAEVTPETLRKAAQTLSLDVEYIQKWQSQKLTVEGGRSLVLVISYLARQNQALLRRAIALIEQLEAQNQDIREISLMRDYLDKFIQGYDQQFPVNRPIPEEDIIPFAKKLLIDLLFYSSPDGFGRFWSTLLMRSQARQRGYNINRSQP
ncbi:MAG: DUF3038 domain-containing protein [Limnospira sp. PMC 1291.21]|uniref:DUF3038 domain-containing protein n=1 Tax=unclassified Limnospira TaxID=2642885 RepID=UPI0028E1852F|nr:MULTISPECIES: DUF3038 domain-containing protein [unclassified Limnospira]MDT9178252.1 DUF3038 domain-containing protein [Limnospira sp. PMC 1238.20]MDT9193587.1 DUF3038 domain-containing protein [Limnospira sp. PMC 1245.20]MDT9203722.1 DUF3038 domain-containing protein [Limnospira sp. PMC 1243.20]MDT9208953.1 DUF3038 domain-containing protein [Limnospira sp. PMC 1252.20]MDT9214110.1 DUF3038 domain-containing protein [Limnospira sp. PMC 1256.20]